ITYTYTDANGCTGSASQSITVNPLPAVTITGNTTICLGQSTTLTANGGSSYSWDSGETTAAITVSPTTTTTTTYTVTATGTVGCTASKSVKVTVNVPVTATGPADQAVYAADTATFTVIAGGTGPLGFIWQFGSTTLSAGGRYSITTSGGSSTLTIANVGA